MIYDQTRAARACQVGPQPLQEHTGAQVSLRQVTDVYEGPSEPCRESAHLQPARLHNCEPFPDHSHITFVKIAERPWFRLAHNPSMDTTLLHLGMVIVGVPYSCQGLVNMAEITGGTPYGATTLAGSDGSRQPSENELEIARFQGKHVAEIAARLLRGAQV
jgi:hypothetical protein